MDEKILLPLDEFADEMATLAEIKQWRTLSKTAAETIFKRFPRNRATGAVEVDATDFFRAIELLQDATERTDPGQIVRFYRAARRERRAKEAQESAVPLERGSVSDEMPEAFYKFVRYGRQLTEAHKRGQKFLPDFDECWNKPLTSEDWDLINGISPAQAISAATGGKRDAKGNPIPPQPDPKERDVVYGGV